MNKKAKSILFKTYWSAQGWKREADTSPEDFEYAKAKGVMFDEVSFDFPELRDELAAVVVSISRDEVVKAFLSSLGTKRLDWRSAIGSYFNAQLVLEGKREFRIPNDTYYHHRDLNVLNFERIKWGGVRHHDLLYNYLDLKLFLGETIPEPSASDIGTFKNILSCIATSSVADYPSTLRDRLKDAMQGSKNDRHNLMEILGACEFLLPQSFERPTSGRHDWTFVEYWRGEDKYNKELVEECFGAFMNSQED
ncbi:MAG: hypothetical protein NWQ53_06325 [Flavobacteriales bacterium]|nr:hypothetical protein [Flavobacteriales bacterium]